MLIGRATRFNPPSIPIERLSRLQRSPRRRIDDAVKKVFQLACMAGELDAAEEPIGVLDNIRERRERKFGGDRRINDDDAIQARSEVRQHNQLRQIEVSRRTRNKHCADGVAMPCKLRSG
jgi:hypothetical protein